MEQNSEETTAALAEGAATDTPTQAPARRRASRRVSTAAGATSESAAASAAPSEAAAPSADAAPAASGETAAPTAEDAAAEQAPKKRATRSRKKAAEDAPSDAPEPAAETDSAAAPTAEGDAPAEQAPKKRATRSRKKAAEPEAPEADAAAKPGETAADVAAAAAAETAASDAAEAIDAEPAKKTGRGRKTRASEAAKTAETADQQGEAASAGAGEQPAAEAGAKQEQPEGAPTGRRRRGRGQKSEAAENDAASAESAERADAGKSGDARAADGGQGSDGGKSQDNAKGAENGKGRDGGRSKGRENGKQQEGGRSEKEERSEGERNGKNASESSRSTRTRQRDRKRRGQNDELEPEIAEDDVLLPVAGILDVLDNYAFVRTTGYLPGTSDVYVSLGQVKKYGLRRGDAVVGAIRQPREGEGGGRQKYNAIVKIDAINGRAVEDDQKRLDFAELTPLYPQEPLRLESAPERRTQRVIDLIAPLGKGQRALLTGPRGTGKSAMLREIAEGVSANAPDAHLMVVLVDERPEEVTDLQRTVKGEVVASTFDRAAEDHITVAELAVERAKRLVELGHDVVVLLDSLTALGHAYAQSAQGTGRGGGDRFETVALHPVKKLLGAARNIENGGSLTIVATALTKTGSETDEAILRELVGTANSRLRLSRKLAEKRLFPAIKLAESSTDREDLLLGEAELRATGALRRDLGGESAADALGSLLKRVGETSSNTVVLHTRAQAGGAS
nr:transcription termination factor Rho [Leucobacter chromiisoli]